MGTHIRGMNDHSNDDDNDNSNDNGNTTTNIDASATATNSNTDGGTEVGINSNGNSGSRRRIVWILPRANEVQFEYVKRCESCPRLHDGHYGSGRFCSSRCARRVGGLAKKRMWDLTHGVSSDLYSNSNNNNTTATTTTATSAQPPLAGVRSDGNMSREQRSPGEATSSSTTPEISMPHLKGLPLSMLPVSMPMDKLSSEHLESSRVMLLGRTCENSTLPALTPLSGRFTPVAIQPQELEYMRTASVDRSERPSKMRRINGSPAKMSLSAILNPS